MGDSQESNVTILSDNSIYGNEPEVTCFFAQKVDEITETEMKKIEVQKMEGELTIRTLEQGYRETKKKLIHAQKKLGEARKKASNQAEQIDRLMRANTAIVEKFRELKNYQNDIILPTVSEFQSASVGCRSKNADLSNELRVILGRSDYLERLKRDVCDKRAVVNADVERKIEEKKGECARLNEVMMHWRQENERVKILLNREMSDYNYNITLIDEHTKRIVQLEADKSAYVQKIAKELEIWEQEKHKLESFRGTNLRIFDEKKALITKLMGELESLIRSSNTMNDSLKELQTKKNELLTEVQSKRTVVDSLKKILDDNTKSICESQVKVTNEIETVKTRFLKKEEDMQGKLKSLHGTLNEKKKLEEKIENFQTELVQLKEKKLAKQKESSNIDQELQDKIKDSANELEKYKQMLSDKNKMRYELDSKIKKLQEEKKSVQLKLETLDKDKENKLRNNSIPLFNAKKTHTSDEIKKKDSRDFPKKEPPTKSTSMTKFDPFGFDESDESEDEKFLKNMSPPKLTQMKTPSHKKPEYNNDFEDVSSNKKTTNHLSNCDMLFENLLSQSPSNTQTPMEPKSTQNDADVFKVPHPYSTPWKRKYLPKYNK